MESTCLEGTLQGSDFSPGERELVEQREGAIDVGKLEFCDRPVGWCEPGGGGEDAAGGLEGGGEGVKRSKEKNPGKKMCGREHPN